MRLAGKVALVTGGASGFGAGIARTFAREGANVAILDLNGPGAKQVASSIGPNAMAIAGDVTAARDVTAAFDSSRARAGQDPRQLRGAGGRRDRAARGLHGRGHAGDAGEIRRHHPAGKAVAAGRYCQRLPLSRLRRGQPHHRRGAGGRWGADDLNAVIPGRAEGANPEPIIPVFQFSTTAVTDSGTPRLFSTPPPPGTRARSAAARRPRPARS